jgi:replicative DNA helicase
MVPLMEDICKAAVEGGDRSTDGLSTPLPSLNHRVGYLEPGHLIIIGGSPSSGKTSFLIGITRENLQRDKRLLYVSLDETRRAVGRRLLVNATGVSSQAIRRGSVSEAIGTKLYQAVAPYLVSDNLTVVDKPGLTVAAIAAMARSLKARDGLDGIFVDYLQQVRPSDPKANRVLQVGAIARELKQMAKDLRVPVIALSQLNRSYDSLNDNQPPRATMLRDSGELEQEASLILFPLVPALVKKRTEGEGSSEYKKVADAFAASSSKHLLAKIVIAKGKEIETGEIECRWNGEAMRFQEEEIEHRVLT